MTRKSLTALASEFKHVEYSKGFTFKPTKESRRLLKAIKREQEYYRKKNEKALREEMFR